MNRIFRVYARAVSEFKYNRSEYRGCWSSPYAAKTLAWRKRQINKYSRRFGKALMQENSQ